MTSFTIHHLLFAIYRFFLLQMKPNIPSYTQRNHGSEPGLTARLPRTFRDRFLHLPFTIYHLPVTPFTRFFHLLFLFSIMLIPSSSLIASAQQETPPPPTAPRPPVLPQPVEKTLPNGLRVIFVGRPGVPLVTSRLIVKSGGEFDPPQLAGLADMTASLLTKGTTTRTAPQIAEAIEALGGSINSFGRWDNSAVQVDVMSKNIEPAIQILADVVRHPSFANEEIERLRQQTNDELLVDLSEPQTIATAVAARLLYGDTPYGHRVDGTPESIARIKRGDVVAFHTNYYRPDNVILVIGGELDAKAAFQLAERFFGDWQQPSKQVLKDSEKSMLVQAVAPKILVVDKPDAGQAAVVLAHRGLRRADPDYFRGIVTNSVLSGYSGRLNQEIRIKRGLSYGAASILDARRDVGPFLAVTQTKNQSGAEVASLLLGEIKRLGDEPVSETELAPRKAVLVGNFGRNLETNAGLVNLFGNLALHGLNLNEINHYVERVQVVKAGDVQKFAGTRLNAKEASIIVVGDAKQFLPALQKQFPSIEVIPAADLDLNTANLRRVQATK
jgi:zinc protease